MTASLINFLISFLASLIAVFLALWVERSRMPALTITAGERANANVGYSEMGEWRFVRAIVVNQPMPWPFGWIPRYTAENCRARIEFLTLDGRPLMMSGRATPVGTMQGRWAGTPEIPHVPHDEVVMTVLFPEPVTIPAGNEELLDVIAQCRGEEAAYGWNNESYLNNWRTPRYMLPGGDYRVRITATTQNGTIATAVFHLHIDRALHNTVLRSL